MRLLRSNFYCILSVCLQKFLGIAPFQKQADLLLSALSTLLSMGGLKKHNGWPVLLHIVLQRPYLYGGNGLTS